MPKGVFPRKSTKERFWEKVNKEPGKGCWIWMADKSGNPTGYGRFKIKGKIKVAHRIAYELTKGPIPEGLQIDHLCRNKSCVRPAHLEAVTGKENCQRATGKSVCLRGHPRIKIKKNGTCYLCELERNKLVRNAEPGKSKARELLRKWRENNREHVNEQAKLRMRKVRKEQPRNCSNGHILSPDNIVLRKGNRPGVMEHGT